MEGGPSGYKQKNTHTVGFTDFFPYMQKIFGIPQQNPQKHLRQKVK